MNYECHEFQVCFTLYMLVPEGLHAVKGDLDWIQNWNFNLGFSSPGSFSSVFLRTFGKNATWKVNHMLSHPTTWSRASFSVAGMSPYVTNMCLPSQSILLRGT